MGQDGPHGARWQSKQMQLRMEMNAYIRYSFEDNINYSSANSYSTSNYTISDRAFSTAAPQAWNWLPNDLKLMRSTVSLK